MGATFCVDREEEWHIHSSNRRPPDRQSLEVLLLLNYHLSTRAIQIDAVATWRDRDLKGASTYHESAP